MTSLSNINSNCALAQANNEIINKKKLKILTFNVRGYNTAERRRKVNLLLEN